MFHEVIMAFRSFPVLWAPIISMAVYLISLIPLIILKRREKKEPGSVKEEKMKAIETCNKVFGFIAIITWVLILGGFLLLNLAVANM